MRKFIDIINEALKSDHLGLVYYWRIHDFSPQNPNRRIAFLRIMGLPDEYAEIWTQKQGDRWVTDWVILSGDAEYQARVRDPGFRHHGDAENEDAAKRHIEQMLGLKQLPEQIAEGLKPTHAKLAEMYWETYTYEDGVVSRYLKSRDDPDDDWAELFDNGDRGIQWDILRQNAAGERYGLVNLVKQTKFKTVDEAKRHIEAFFGLPVCPDYEQPMDIF